MPEATGAGRVRQGLIVLTLINLFNYLDRFVVPSLLESIKKSELHPSDTQLFSLVPAFTVVYMLAAPVFGPLGDRRARPPLIALGVLIWSVATALGGFARSYATLFLARATVGVGEAAYGTIAPSLLADYYPRQYRGRVAGTAARRLELLRRAGAQPSVRAHRAGVRGVHLRPGRHRHRDALVLAADSRTARDSSDVSAGRGDRRHGTRGDSGGWLARGSPPLSHATGLSVAVGPRDPGRRAARVTRARRGRAGRLLDEHRRRGAAAVRVHRSDQFGDHQRCAARDPRHRRRGEHSRDPSFRRRALADDHRRDLGRELPRARSADHSRGGARRRGDLDLRRLARRARRR